MSKLKVIIDTNIVYSICKLSINSKVPVEITDLYDCYITSAALVEVIVKYRSDLENLKIIFNTIQSNNIKIIDSKLPDFDANTISNIIVSGNSTASNKLIDDVFTMKLKLESEFFRWIFTIITIGIFEVDINQETKLSKIEVNKLYTYLSSMYEANEKYILDFFLQKSMGSV